MKLDGSEKIKRVASTVPRQLVEEAQYDIGNERVENGFIGVCLTYP